jgi:hypothetical protein
MSSPSAGTLLSDLNDKPSGGDGDLLRQILSDMNGQGGSTAAPPPMGNNMSAQLPPVNQATMHMMDPNVPSAHMIGAQHPTPADFANMLQHSPVQMQQAWPQQMAQSGNFQKNVYGKLSEEAKLPILVAIVVFIVTLPAVTVLFAHYAPSMLKPGGDFNTLGLLARALLAGGGFWILQRVVAPLLSL